MAKKKGEGIELNIQGYFTMNITDMFGNQVEEDIEQGILDNLQQGEYVIGIGTQTIMDINEFNPIYKFTLNAQDSAEYDFDKLLN